MDADERLSLDQIREHSFLAAHHLHRYELAARLCRGLRVIDLGCGIGYGTDMIARGGAASAEGVDIDKSAIEQARTAFASESLSFVEADATSYLTSLDRNRVDAIIAFESLEHLEALEDALVMLEKLAAAGVKLLLSVPNSRTFHEENEFHLTDFGYEEARAMFERFDDVVLLHQHLAEGSVICGAGDGFSGTVKALEYAEPDYANTFIAVVGFGADAVKEVTAHLNLIATPNHNRYMIGLEAANRELWRTNLRLAKGLVGMSDAAAVSVSARYERQIDEMREKVAQIEQTMHAELVRFDALRYRFADAVCERLIKVPGMRRVGPAVLRKLMRSGHSNG